MLNWLREWLESKRRKGRDQGGEIYNLRQHVSCVRHYKEISGKMKRNDKEK